jgi:hypothetical protein
MFESLLSKSEKYTVNVLIVIVLREFSVENVEILCTGLLHVCRYLERVAPKSSRRN